MRISLVRSEIIYRHNKLRFNQIPSWYIVLFARGRRPPAIDQVDLIPNKRYVVVTKSVRV